MKELNLFSHKPEYVPRVEQSEDEELEDLLNQFPSELRDVWEEKILDLDGKRAKNLLRVALEEREKVLGENSGYIAGDPSLRKEVDMVMQEIEALPQTNRPILGKGEFARVHLSPHSDKVCIKFLTDPVQEEFHRKSIKKEAEFLKSMYQFVVDGVRTPYAYFMGSKNPPYYIGMEKIDGKSLFAILEDKESNQDLIAIIKSQKKDDVIRRIKNFLEQMHVAKKIVHNDIHSGNIMVDRKGDWYVIDFGRSQETKIGDISHELEVDDIKFLYETIDEFYANI